MTQTKLPASRSSSWWSAWASWFTVCKHISSIREVNVHSTPTHWSCVSLANLYALSLLRAFSEEESLVAIGALYPQEAIGSVSYSRWQHLVTQHGIDHRALPITGPIERKQHNSQQWLQCFYSFPSSCFLTKLHWKVIVLPILRFINVPAVSTTAVDYVDMLSNKPLHSSLPVVDRVNWLEVVLVIQLETDLLDFSIFSHRFSDGKWMHGLFLLFDTYLCSKAIKICILHYVI